MKILQIAYYYPPMGGAGVQRGLKFSRYLPLHGVTPVVLAGHDPHYVRDASLLAEVPADLEVHRVEHSPWLARLAARRRSAAPAAASPAAPSSSTSGRARRPQSALRDRVLSGIRSLQWPDEMAAWSRDALRRGREILHAHAARGAPIELVFSSSPPPSVHVLGERLAREFGLPWVADFRDLWTDNPAYDAPAWRRRVDRALEDRWLQRATGIVTVTPSWRGMLARRRAAGQPVAFIPNGYDEEDFAALTQAPGPGLDFTLAHTGTFYGPRDPAGLLEGLGRYLESAPAAARPLRLRLVGNMGARFSVALAQFEARHPGVVQAVPYLPHAQALAELMAADALLLVVGGSRGPAVSGWLPGKIFEYLRSGKPVLTLGDPQGDAADLIRRHGRGITVPGDDAAAVAGALSVLVQGRTIAADAPPESPAVFERRELARQLADFLRQCHAMQRPR